MGAFYNGGMYAFTCACTQNSPSLTAPLVSMKWSKPLRQTGNLPLPSPDLNNLFGAIKFYKEGRGKGVKPLLGAEIYL